MKSLSFSCLALLAGWSTSSPMCGKHAAGPTGRARTLFAVVLLLQTAASGRADARRALQDAESEETHTPVESSPYWHTRVGTHHAHFHSGESSGRYTHHYHRMKKFYETKYASTPTPAATAAIYSLTSPAPEAAPVAAEASGAGTATSAAAAAIATGAPAPVAAAEVSSTGNTTSAVAQTPGAEATTATSAAAGSPPAGNVTSAATEAEGTGSATSAAGDTSGAPGGEEAGAEEKAEATAEEEAEEEGMATPEVKRTRAGRKGGVVFQPDGSPWQTEAMIKLLNGTVTEAAWIDNVLVRHEFAAFQRECEPLGFVEALARYVAVYFHALDPEVPPEDKRILVVRDALARTGVGLGIQMLFYAKWLLLGMATDRAVFFQFCRDEEEEEEWLELAPREWNQPPPACLEDPSYDLGDFFGLLGGVDLRWTPTRARAMRAQGLKNEVVSSCSTEQRPGADPPRHFICNCCEEECAAKLKRPDNDKSRPPDEIVQTVADFWTKGGADEIPWITFEYRSTCAKFGWMEWRFDTRKHWYVRELGDILQALAEHPAPRGCGEPRGRCITGGLLPEGWAKVLDPGQRAKSHHDYMNRVPSYDNQVWGDCARFAMFTPTPTIQHILALPSMLPRFQEQPRRIVSALHIRTMAVDTPQCFAADTKPSWAAIDAEFDYLPGLGKKGGPETCRRGPSICEAPPMDIPFSFFLTRPFGGLSGLFKCAHKVNGVNITLKRGPDEVDHSQAPMLMATSDAESLQAFLEGYYKEDIVTTEGQRIMALWNNVNTMVAIQNRLGRDRDEAVGHEEHKRGVTADEIEAGWLKGVLDMYMLGAADIIFAPIPSFFSFSAAMRSLPPTPLVGLHEDLCKLFATYEHEAEEVRLQNIRADLEGLTACFTEDIDLSDPDHARQTFQHLTEEADLHESLDQLENRQKEREEKIAQARERLQQKAAQG